MTNAAILCFFALIITMFPPSFPMMENNFWTSEQWSLTSIWMKIFTSTSRRHRTYCSPFMQAPWWKLRQRVHKRPIPSVLLGNIQSPENKLDELCSRLSYQRDLKNCNILWFSESWLNKDMDNMHLAVFLFIGRTKQQLRVSTSRLEYLMKSCRPYYLPRDFSSIFL